MGFRHVHFCTIDYSYSFCKGFRHTHFCMNDYPFHYLLVFMMHISVRMTIPIHISFPHAHFCTYDYPYSFWMGFRHAHFCKNDCSFLCIRVFVMHISVRMTINFIVYGFSSWIFLYEWLSILCVNGFSSSTFLYEWLSISLWMDFRHSNFCTNDFPYSFGFFVMYIFVRITICSQFLSNAFLLRTYAPLVFWTVIVHEIILKKV